MTMFASVSTAQTPLPNFCERLAPQIGLKPKPPTGKEKVPVWEVNTLGGLKTALLGGRRWCRSA
ncbi:hypothetical protein [Sphingomonas sp. Mn802worker]|uniref:hypothetical protein n=1 Tax=Sphingomonas sp. Mn802worker TaxID=629773 RepID=UPI0012EAFEDE|nr:hypothetical protein [Sphingomonas sp. Mn802worker]